MSEFTDEYKRRRNRRNKKLLSIPKLILHILALILVLLLIKFFSNNGVGNFFDLLTGTGQTKTSVIKK